MAPFIDAVKFLGRLGVHDVILPWMFIFVITFGILQKSKVLGTIGTQPKTKYNAIVAFIFAFLFVGFQGLVGGLNNFLPFIGLLAVILFAVALIVNFLGGSMKASWWYTFAVLGIVFYTFFIAFGVDVNGFFEAIFTGQVMTILIAIAVFGLLIYFIIGGKDSGRTPAKKPKPAKQATSTTAQTPAATPQAPPNLADNFDRGSAEKIGSFSKDDVTDPSGQVIFKEK